MISFRHARGRVAIAAMCAALGVAVVYSADSSASPAKTTLAETTLVIDKSFDIKTADPQREFEPTGNIVDHAIYDTLLQYKGSDVSHPLPDLATSYTVSDNAKVFVFTLRRGVVFSNGAPLTSADVVFSFRRLINLKGEPSFLLGGVTAVAARGRYTVVLKSGTSNPAIPAIVTNPALGIVNSHLVIQHGGSDASNADVADKAESFLDSTSAGSGPYVLTGFSTTTQVVLHKNPRYWGSKPKFDVVVIRNVPASSQLLDVQRGTNEIALDLSPSQVGSLTGVNVEKTPSGYLMYLDLNENPKISDVSSNSHIRAAIRDALDYSGIDRLVGPGSVQASSVIPSMLLGALPRSAELKQDLLKAKTEVNASGLANPTLNLEYPSDVTLSGVSFGVVAEKIKSDLAQVGITVNLVGSPFVTSISNYRDGKEAFGLWYWGPDYPDPSDYLVYLPGGLLGSRVGWNTGTDPALQNLATRASETPSPAQRGRLFQTIAQQLNRVSPFIPLVQVGQVVAASKNLTGVTYNILYWVDPAAVGGR
jgi:peptide/nickel transport system substrate-binding protein